MSILRELDPRVRKAMEDDKKNYPTMVQFMIEDIQNAYLTSDIKVSTAVNLIGYAETAGVVFNHPDSFVLKLYQIFNR